MSLQVCHCGWSKVTTYQGLRTHQGKKGCTPKGVKVEESEQQYMWGNLGFIKGLELDVKTDIADYYSDRSLQVCHYCGWSKVTTYQGLRTHQGMMGCTPKGERIPKRELYDWKSPWEEVDQKKHQTAKRTAVKKATVPMSPSTNVRTSSPTTKATIKEEYKPDYETPQHSFHTATNSKSRRQLHDFSTGVQMADSRMMTGNWSNGRSNSATTAAAIKEEPKSPSAISRRPSHRATKTKSVCQPRDLYTSVQDNRSVKERPAFPPLVTVVQPGEKDRKDQTSSQVRSLIRERPTTTHPATVARPEEKRREDHTSSQNVTPLMVMKPVYRPPLVPLSPRINCAAPATIKEEPKSPFAAPQGSFQKVTNSKASHQVQDFCTGVQVNRSNRECPVPPLISAVQPREKDRKNQTLPQARQERVKSELQQKIQLREEKMSEIIQMETACESVPDSTSTNTQMNSAAAETRINQDPKSLCESAWPDPSTGMRGKELIQIFSAATTQETAVQPKEKDREEQNLPQNVPDSTSATTQINPASAEATTGEDPVSPASESAQLSDFSTGLKVKELAQMFSSTTAQEAAVRPNEKHKPSVRFIAQKVSATTAQETEVKPKQKEERTKNQNLPQNVPDSTIATTQMNPASAEATTGEDRTSSASKTAQLRDFSTGLKVKDLARMFSATTTQEMAFRPDERRREERKLSHLGFGSMKVKFMCQKLSATTAKETAVHLKEKDKKDQNLPQNVSDSTSTATQMNPASAETTTEGDPKSSCEMAQLSDFSTCLKVKELARMFSATTTQETAVRPKEKHREERKLSQWI